MKAKILEVLLKMSIGMVGVAIVCGAITIEFLIWDMLAEVFK